MTLGSDAEGKKVDPSSIFCHNVIQSKHASSAHSMWMTLYHDGCIPTLYLLTAGTKHEMIAIGVVKSLLVRI